MLRIVARLRILFKHRLQFFFSAARLSVKQSAFINDREIEMKHSYTVPSTGEVLARRANYIRHLKNANWQTDDLTALRADQEAVDPDEFLWHQFAPIRLWRRA